MKAIRRPREGRLLWQIVKFIQQFALEAGQVLRPLAQFHFDLRFVVAELSCEIADSPALVIFISRPHHELRKLRVLAAVWIEFRGDLVGAFRVLLTHDELSLLSRSKATATLLKQSSGLVHASDKPRNVRRSDFETEDVCY